MNEFRIGDLVEVEIERVRRQGRVVGHALHYTVEVLLDGFAWSLPCSLSEVRALDPVRAIGRLA